MSQTKREVVNLLPHQYDMVMCTAPQVMCVGGYGSGKSRGLCYAAVAAVAKRPHAVALLARMTYTSLRRSTLRTLLESDGGASPVLPAGTYEYKIAEQRIDVHGGGTILLAGLEDILRLRGLSLSAVFVDEAIEVPMSVWDELRGRLRNTAARHRQIMGATNPSSPSHWIYRRFYGQPSHDCVVIKAPTTANPYLPKDYVHQLEALKTTDLPSYLRYVQGEWAISSDLIFADLINQELPAPPPRESMDKYVLGVDAGWTHPTAAVLLGAYGGAWWAIEEYMVSRKTHDVISRELYRAYGELPVTVIVDPSAPALMEALRIAGFTDVKGGNNAIDYGIDVIRRDIHRQVLVITDAVPSLTAQMMAYHRDTEGKPAKIADDLVDAFRYAAVAVGSIDSGVSQGIYVAVLGQSTQDLDPQDKFW